jgi:hypothetical protein
MDKEEEAKKREEKEKPADEKTKTFNTSKLILMNLVLFIAVAGGLMLISGHSFMDLLGLGFWAAKSKDPDSL